MGAIILRGPFLANIVYNAIHNTSYLFTTSTAFFRFVGRFLIFKTNTANFVASFHLCFFADAKGCLHAFHGSAVIVTFGPFLTDFVDLTIMFASFPFNIPTTLIVNWLNDKLIVVVIRMSFYRRTVSF